MVLDGISKSWLWSEVRALYIVSEVNAWWKHKGVHEAEAASHVFVLFPRVIFWCFWGWTEHGGGRGLAEELPGALW